MVDINNLSGGWRPIEWFQAYEDRGTLGLWYSPAGESVSHKYLSLEKIKNWVKKLSRGFFNRKHVWRASKSPSGTHSGIWFWKQVSPMRIGSNFSSYQELNPPPHGYMKDLSHVNETCPSKVLGVCTPIVQTITVYFQAQRDPNADSIHHYNVIIYPQKPVTGSTRGMTKYTFLKYTCKLVSKIEYKLGDVVSM